MRSRKSLWSKKICSLSLVMQSFATPFLSICLYLMLQSFIDASDAKEYPVWRIVAARFKVITMCSAHSASMLSVVKPKQTRVTVAAFIPPLASLCCVPVPIQTNGTWDLSCLQLRKVHWNACWSGTSYQQIQGARSTPTSPRSESSQRIMAAPVESHIVRLKLSILWREIMLWLSVGMKIYIR